MVTKILATLVKGYKNRINLYPKLFRANSVWTPRIAKGITPTEKDVFERYILTKNKVRDCAADIIVSNKAAMRGYCAVGQLANNQPLMQVVDNIDDLWRFFV